MSAPAAIEAAISEANAEIHRKGQVNLAFHNMGTTCSALLLLPQGALVAHVGDSRVYRLRAKRLHQLTFDHSLVWEMRHAGQVDSIDGSGIPKNVITRSLGPQPQVRVDLEGPFPLEVGDTFLLCSDGLTGRITDSEIATILNELPPADAAKLLINYANLRGGPDNITVLIAKVTGTEMTTRANSSAPLIVGEPDIELTPIHVGLWLALGIFLMLAAVCFAIEKTLFGLGSLVAAGVCGLAVLFQKLGLWQPAGEQLRGGRRLGRAPYQKAEPLSTEEFLAQLAASMQQVREGAEKQGWDVAWGPVEQACSAAEAAADVRQTTEALKQYSQAMSHFVGECRRVLKAPHEAAGDS